MKKIESKRQVVIEKIADHLLVHGLKGSSLRKNGGYCTKRAIGMLLYYFADKRELMTAASYPGNSPSGKPFGECPPEKMTFQIFLPHLAKMMKDPEFVRILRLSLELVALAAEKKDPMGPSSGKSLVRFFGWIASALQVDRERLRFPWRAGVATTEGVYALGCSRLRISIITDALEGITIRSSASSDND